jgi:hypothetical protein
MVTYEERSIKGGNTGQAGTSPVAEKKTKGSAFDRRTPLLVPAHGTIHEAVSCRVAYPACSFSSSS